MFAATVAALLSFVVVFAANQHILNGGLEQTLTHDDVTSNSYIDDVEVDLSNEFKNIRKKKKILEKDTPVHFGKAPEIEIAMDKKKKIRFNDERSEIMTHEDATQKKSDISEKMTSPEEIKYKNQHKKRNNRNPQQDNAVDEEVNIIEDTELGTIYSTKTESWSADNKIHCVQETENTISCHTQDDIENHRDDENLINPALVEKSMIREKIKKDFTPKRNKPSNLSTDPTTNEQNVRDHSELMKEPPLKMNLNGKEPTFVNSRTGQSKPPSELESQEEVDVESLTSAPRHTNNSDRSIFRTIQEVLDHLHNQSSLPLSFDRSDPTSHTLWPEDHSCRMLLTRFGNNVPEVDLVSYPHSGSSWFRYLLEGLTGIFTGMRPTKNSFKESKDSNFFRPGDTEPVYSRRTLTSLTHSVSATSGVTIQKTRGTRDNVPALLLIRNPSEAFTAHWLHLNTSSNVDVDSSSKYSSFDSREFHSFVGRALENWELMYSNRLLWSRHVHIVHYEQLRQRPLLELLKVLSFIKLPAPSTERLECLKKYIARHTEDHGKMVTYDPFSTSEEDLMWAATTRVSALLKLRGSEVPSYYIHPSAYPPDRIFKRNKNFNKMKHTRSSAPKVEL